MGNRIYGCDDCLAVCPWNKFAQGAREAKLRAREELAAPPLVALLALDDSAFRRILGLADQAYGARPLHPQRADRRRQRRGARSCGEGGAGRRGAAASRRSRSRRSRRGGLGAAPSRS